MRWNNEATNCKIDVWRTKSRLPQSPRSCQASASRQATLGKASHLCSTRPPPTKCAALNHCLLVVIVIVRLPCAATTTWHATKRHCREESTAVDDNNGSERLCVFSVPVDMLVWLLLVKVKSTSFSLLVSYHSSYPSILSFQQLSMLSSYFSQIRKCLHCTSTSSIMQCMHETHAFFCIHQCLIRRAISIPRPCLLGGQSKPKSPLGLQFTCSSNRYADLRRDVWSDFATPVFGVAELIVPRRSFLGR